MSPARLIAVLVAVNAALIAIGAIAIGSGGIAGAERVHVGLVFDVGGKNDQSFNESAWRGLQRAREQLGVHIEFIEPSEGTDRESALRSLAAHGDDLVIAVGFIFSADLERIAVRFPNVKFAGVDYAPTSDAPLPPNLAGITFREHDGSFVVGAIAGMLTHTHVVGFVGGMQTPLIRKFEAGYVAGVRYACAGCRVVSAYAGADPRAFADPPRGAELAAALYAQDADIIYHAAGKTGDGVFAAARERDERAIGVDSDQFSRAPCCIVTSMVKHVDLAVVDIIADVVAGRFRGGVHEHGLGDRDGVGFVADDRNRTLLPIEVVERARKISDAIIAGTIVVPSR